MRGACLIAALNNQTILLMFPFSFVPTFLERKRKKDKRKMDDDPTV